ncbi:glycosyltransferase family 4 protein [Arthrobacter sp. Sr33]
MPLRVLVATRIYAPETGAAAFRLAAMVKALEGRGHRVTVLTTSAPGSRKSSPTVRRWPVLRDKSGAVRGYVQYASFDIPLFFRLLTAPAFDLIVVEPPPTTGVVVRIAAALRRRPFVYFAADVSSVAAEGIGVSPAVVRVLRAVERWTLSGARRILTVSEGVSTAVASLIGPSDRIINVGTGVDTEQFTSDGPTGTDKGRYFVYAGTMSEIQGAGVFVDGFIAIAKEFPDVRLVMLGQGVEGDALRERAQAAAAPIEFRGNVDGGQVSAALRGSVAGLASVRPSRGYDFAFATKALVSLSCGTPVIYAGVGPLKDIIADEGLGVSVEWDAAEVAAAMRAALTWPQDPAERQRISQWVEENYSLTGVGAKAAAVIEAAARD